MDCPGIKPYSAYKNGIGYDLKRVVMSKWPPDTARDYECTVFYEKSSTRKTQLCKKCVSLKWCLSARKMEHDQLIDEHSWQRQQAKSTVPFDILSPGSKKARLSSMRQGIANLWSQAKCNAENIELTSMNDKQNYEIVELVKSINSSARTAIKFSSGWQRQGWPYWRVYGNKTFQTWKFYQDQKQNGE